MVAAAVVLGWCTGCASLTVVGPEELGVSRAEDGSEIVAHIHALNWGWYLLPFFPLATGDLEAPGALEWCRFFHDNVDVESVVGRVGAEALELGGTRLVGLRSTDRSGWVHWTLVLWLREVEVSATVVRQPTSADATGRDP